MPHSNTDHREGLLVQRFADDLDPVMAYERVPK